MMANRGSFVSFLFLCALVHRSPFENRILIRFLLFEINYIHRMITVSWFPLPAVHSGNPSFAVAVSFSSCTCRGPNKV